MADAAAGREALKKGDYERALSEWQNAADNGDAEAQLGLGSLYEEGAGDLKRDLKRSDYWYRKAAEQGNTEARYRLALIWGAGGDGFPPDLIKAYKWAVLATESKGVWSSVAADLRTQLDRVMSPRERDQGKERAAAWKEARQHKREFAQVDVSLADFAWRKGGFGNVMVATFTIENKNPFPIKDITVVCEMKAPSGTGLGGARNTIYQIIKANGRKTVRDFSMGHIHNQATQALCKIEDWHEE